MNDDMRDELSGASASSLESLIHYMERRGVCLFSEWGETCQRVMERE